MFQAIKKILNILKHLIRMDVGPFLLILKYIHNSCINYNYILKLHTKTNKKWRENMMNELIDYCPTKYSKEVDINGIYGHKKIEYDYLNHIYVCFLLNQLNINLFNEQQLYITKI